MLKCSQKFHFLVEPFVNTLASRSPSYLTSCHLRTTCHTKAKWTLKPKCLPHFSDSGHDLEPDRTVIWISLVSSVYLLSLVETKFLVNSSNKEEGRSKNWGERIEQGMENIFVLNPDWFWRADLRCSYHISRYSRSSLLGAGNTHRIHVG